MHLAFLEVINEDSFEIKCLGRPWKQSPIPDWQKSNFNLYFIQPAGPVYSLLCTLTAWWLWGKQGCGKKKKQTAKWGGTCIGEGESGNYPQVWLGFVFLCFGPLPAFPSGLLKTLHSSVGLKKILGTQCGRQDNWQGKPWGDWVCDAQSLEAPSPDTFLVCALQLFASPKELPTHPFVWALQDILKSVLNFNNLGLK